MNALRLHEEPVPWLAVLESSAEGTCEVTSAPIGGPADPAFFDVDTLVGDPPLLDILSWCEENHVAQLWVHPSYVLAHELLPLPAEWLDPGDGWRFAPRDEYTHGWLRCWHQGLYGKRTIYLPLLDERASGQLWSGTPDGRTLLEAVLRYNVAIGYPFVKSPGRTAIALLQSLHGAHPHWLEGNGPAIPPARKSNAERRYDWCRPLMQSERHADVLVSYDKNAMYLGACSSLECGYGEPEHLEHLSVFDDRCGLPGYYRVEWEHHLSPLPPVITGHREDDGTIWVTQPTLTLAIAEREVYSIVEAYIWPRHHRILQPWYTRLRDARAQLRAEPGAAAALALDMVKLTYAQGIAWLDANWLRDGSAAGLYRPHWRHGVIAQARANLYRALAKVYQVTGIAPFAIIEDACYFLVSDAQAAILRGIIPVEDGLGGFKLQDRLLAPTAIVEAIDAAPLGGEYRAFTRALAKVEG